MPCYCSEWRPNFILKAQRWHLLGGSTTNTYAFNIFFHIGICIRFILLNVRLSSNIINTYICPSICPYICPSILFTILKGVATVILISWDERHWFYECYVYVKQVLRAVPCRHRSDDVVHTAIAVMRNVVGTSSILILKGVSKLKKRDFPWNSWLCKTFFVRHTRL